MLRDLSSMRVLQISGDPRDHHLDDALFVYPLLRSPSRSPGDRHFSTDLSLIPDGATFVAYAAAQDTMFCAGSGIPC
jgi:hypothetical protein